MLKYLKKSKKYVGECSRPSRHMQHTFCLVQWDEKKDTDSLHASGRGAEYKGFLEGTGYSRVHKPGSLSSVLGTHRGRENQLDRVVLCPSVCAAACMRLRSHTRILRLHNSSESTLRFSVLICCHQNGLNAEKELASPLHVSCTKQTSIPRAGLSSQKLCCLPPPQISSAGLLASASQMRKLRLSLH